MKDTLLIAMRLGFDMIDPQEQQPFIKWYKCGREAVSEARI